LDARLYIKQHINEMTDIPNILWF